MTSAVTNDTFITEAGMSPPCNYECINTVLVNGHYIVAMAVANLNLCMPNVGIRIYKTKSCHAMGVANLK